MVRDIAIKDKVEWEKLYQGYADFYKVEITEKILNTVWNWLHDTKHELNGLVFEVDNNIAVVFISFECLEFDGASVISYVNTKGNLYKGS